MAKHIIVLFGLSIVLGLNILNSQSSTFFADRARGLGKKNKNKNKKQKPKPKPKTLDFIVAGFPHCGSSSMMKLLDSHNETVFLDDGETEEYKLRVFYEKYIVDQLFQDLKPYRKSPKKTGIRWDDILTVGANSIDMINQPVPADEAAKIVIGVRHPILWFESYYNDLVYSSFNETHRAPNPYILAEGPEKMWDNLYTSHARYDLDLMKLGKVTVESSDFLKLDVVLSTPSKVFIYEKYQLEDTEKGRSDKFLKELEEFLELTNPLEALPLPEVKNETFAGKINICHPDWNDLRTKLRSHAQTSQKFIVKRFLTSNDVAIGNRNHFMKLLDSYRLDPCAPPKKKKGKKKKGKK